MRIDVALSNPRHAVSALAHHPRHRIEATALSHVPRRVQPKPPSKSCSDCIAAIPSVLIIREGDTFTLPTQISKEAEFSALSRSDNIQPVKRLFSGDKFRKVWSGIAK